jgi:pyrroline-5-carboxylate reductase
MKIGFLGGGNMAAALIGGLHGRHDIVVVEPDADKGAQLVQRYGVSHETAPAGLWDCDVIVLAVKPQQLRAALAGWPRLRPEQLVISVAAGIRAGDISRWLQGHAALVRCMPNTPALIGAGISGLFAMPEVTTSQREVTAHILAAAGAVVWVDDEAGIDAVTAISGSGPAYVFLCMEALEAAARERGLATGTARQLALHTFLGAARLAAEDGSEPAELRARVTSKGGTTERGIAALEAAHIRAAFAAAVKAAAERAAEMADLFGKDA